MKPQITFFNITDYIDELILHIGNNNRLIIDKKNRNFDKQLIETVITVMGLIKVIVISSPEEVSNYIAGTEKYIVPEKLIIQMQSYLNHNHITLDMLNKIEHFLNNIDDIVSINELEKLQAELNNLSVPFESFAYWFHNKESGN